MTEAALLTSAIEADINEELVMQGVDSVSTQKVESPNNTVKPTTTTLEEADASMNIVDDASKAAVDEVVALVAGAGGDINLVKKEVQEKVAKVVHDGSIDDVGEVKITGAKKIVKNVVNAVENVDADESIVKIVAEEAEKALKEVADDAKASVKKNVPAVAPVAIKKSITFDPIVLKTASVPVCVGEFFNDASNTDTSIGMCAVNDDGTCPTTLGKMCTTDRATINTLLTGATLTLF